MKWEIIKKFSAENKSCFTIYPGTGVKPQRNVICFSPIFPEWNGHLIMKECLKKADQAFPR